MTKIALNNYKNLLTEIQKQIAQAQSNVIQNITRQKVVMAWNVGKIINEHLSRNTKTGYGEKLIEQLAQDTSMADKVLYKMRSFYQAYPKLPKDDNRLNWTHYQKLSGVKESEERKRLEILAQKNSWTTNDLQLEVTKSKTEGAKTEKTPNGKGKFAKKDSAETNKKSLKKSSQAKLRPERGKLFSYPLIKLPDADVTCIDLGFNFFKTLENQDSKSLKSTNLVDVTKKKESYSFKKSDVHPRKFNTYKAYLERVVDGDTIRVTIDLGFKNFHKEIIRLKGIDAPEIKTEQGKKSARALKNILSKAPFLIIKTIKIDIYGRYVADVFFSENKSETESPYLGGSSRRVSATKGVQNLDPQKVSDEGVYLNQLLLDKKLVTILKE